MKRILSALLAALTFASVLAACGETPDAPQTAVAPDAAEVTTEAEVETTTAELKPDIPDADFGGRNFVWLTSGDSDDNGSDWVTYDVYAEEQNGDAINDAVYARNLYLAETYNVVISEVQGVTYTLASKAVLAGDNSYDAVITNLNKASTLAQNGQLINLRNIPYVDLSQPWWDQNAVRTLSIAGNNYYAAGDITCITNDATWTLMFNKQLAADFGLDFYAMVNADEWYYDKMYAAAQGAALDLNGDGAMKREDDQYGVIGTGNLAPALLYAGGMLIADKDSDDLPALTLDLDRMSSVADKAGMLCADGMITMTDATYSGATPEELRLAFQNGQGLFYVECMQCVKRMRESETDFGVLPFPKFFESQDHYNTFVHYTAGKCCCVLMTQTDLELAGTVLEAMAAKSRYTLTVAYYDISMTTKFVRDEESAGMLDILLQNRIYDLGYIYDWGGMFTALQSVVNKNSGDFASQYESKLAACRTAMDKTIAFYLENNG